VRSTVVQGQQLLCVSYKATVLPVIAKKTGPTASYLIYLLAIIILLLPISTPLNNLKLVLEVLA
jgi:hypothetical protein